MVLAKVVPSAATVSSCVTAVTALQAGVPQQLQAQPSRGGILSLIWGHFKQVQRKCPV